jgi:hypothetical protein
MRQPANGDSRNFAALANLGLSPFCPDSKTSEQEDAAGDSDSSPVTPLRASQVVQSGTPEAELAAAVGSKHLAMPSVTIRATQQISGVSSTAFRTGTPVLINRYVIAWTVERSPAQ